MRKKAERMPEMFERLAIYNSEVARGLVHTPDYDEQMADLQASFDKWSAQQFGVVVPVRPFPTRPSPSR